MPDETFRPQKKPINPADIVKFQQQRENTPEENQAQLDQIAQIRQMASHEAHQEVANPLKEQPFSISGNMNNPAAKKLMEVIQSQGEGEQSPVATQFKPKQPMQPKFSDKPMPGVKQDNLLKELLAKLNENSFTHYNEVMLPSLGKFYNGDDGPTDGILHIKPMTGRQEAILTDPKFTRKFSFALNAIFSECIQERYNPDNFISEDREYLLIYLRGISYTPEYNVEIRCPECEREFQTTIDLAALQVEHCPDNFGPSKLHGKLPISGFDFKYRLARGFDEQILEDYKERQSKFDLSNRVDDTVLYRLSLLINDIAGLTDKEDIKTLLMNLPANDMSYLRTAVNNDVPFGVDIKSDIQCQRCTKDIRVGLPIGVGFFFPVIQKEKQE